METLSKNVFDTIVVSEIVMEDDYRVRKELEWKNSINLLKDPLLIKIIKLTLAAIFLATAIILFVLHQTGTFPSSLTLVIAVIALLIFVYLASSTITNILKAKRISKIYYKRVQALLDKELSVFDESDGISIELTINENETSLNCSQQGHTIKDIHSKTKDIQVNEFDGYITIDLDKVNTYTFSTKINKGDLSKIRAIFRAQANSYTCIEKGNFGRYHLESMKQINKD